jgi:hypothetical protein
LLGETSNDYCISKRGLLRPNLQALDHRVLSIKDKPRPTQLQLASVKPFLELQAKRIANTKPLIAA